jgi:hypothetical protein
VVYLPGKGHPIICGNGAMGLLNFWLCTCPRDKRTARRSRGVHPHLPGTCQPSMQVNMSLRQQARAGMVYAPGLTYVPPTGPGNGNGLGPAANGNGGGGVALATAPAAAPAAVTAAVIAPPAPAAAAAAAPATDRTLLSMDEDEMTPDQLACRWGLVRGRQGPGRRASSGQCPRGHRRCPAALLNGGPSSVLSRLDRSAAFAPSLFAPLPLPPGTRSARASGC